jgi:hypothetical protein
LDAANTSTIKWMTLRDRNSAKKRVVKLPHPNSIDAFRADTGFVVDQFLTSKITLPDCLNALADAFTKVKLKLERSELPALTGVVMANNARVMTEAEKRERNRRVSREYYRKSKTKNQT